MNPFSNWAVYAHKDDTGLGRQASYGRSVLHLGQHLVIPSERLTDHSINLIDEFILPRDAPQILVRERLANLEGIIFFERPDWHPNILEIARDMKIKTVCVPNWEWFKVDAPQWRYCDLFACPTNFTQRILRSFGFANTCRLTWPVDLSLIPKRSITGPARHFIHNAGLVDQDDRKGTRDTIRAFCRLRRNDIRLTVRMQKAASLPRFDHRVSVIIGNLETFSDLYAQGDVCIQPSKMEGIGFNVLEPVCAGMPVITTDYPPMNEFIHQPELRCQTRWFKRKAFASQWISHAHLKLPRIRDLAKRISWAATNDLNSISTGNRAWAEAAFNPEHLRVMWQNALNSQAFPKT